MKFLDQVKLQVKAGKGGDGVISFRREFRVDKGGPDGGDGGHGGSIYFVGDTGLNTLFTLKFNKIIKGNDGENGRGKNQYGAKGENKYIKVPLGTIVKNGEKIIADITEEKKYLIASGGKGGKGNAKFKTSRNTAPRLSENGDPGEQLNLFLSLKVLADVGFVGKPSAGKSTLLSKISNAKPKIASYSFTTLTPQLGFVYAGDNDFVAADLPGLIEGASKGKGLGYEFLKHIERCRLIAHIIDFGSEEKNPIEDYEIINNELKSYDFELENKKQVVIANKMDKSIFKEKLMKFKKRYPNLEVISISALEEKGISQLKNKLSNELKTIKEVEFNTNLDEVTIELEDDIKINNPFTGFYEITGNEIKRIYDKIPLNSNDNLRRFNKLMKNTGVWELLNKKGIKDGDTVIIYDYEFIWGEEYFNDWV
ncbi:MAG: GTPase ObgE [Mycoplasmatales bacterium]|nr:GTPase ObgE [Mycoplasmatales bacterium]